MIPTKTLEAILHWQEYGTHPSALGSFVRALLTNNLREAVICADEEDLANLGDTVRWVYMNVPSATYGSTDALLLHHKRRHRESA
jgi:hypothetical protein